MQVPKGYKFVSVPGYGDCLFRALLIKETQDSELLDVQVTSSETVRRLIADRANGDLIPQSVHSACESVFTSNSKFQKLIDPLLDYVNSAKRDSIAQLVQQRSFDNGKFNYYYADGIKECFKNIDLKPEHKVLFEEFCNTLSWSISEHLLDLTRINVNIMLDPKQPIIIYRHNHFDILLPTDNAA